MATDPKKYKAIGSEIVPGLHQLTSGLIEQMNSDGDDAKDPERAALFHQRTSR